MRIRTVHETVEKDDSLVKTVKAEEYNAVFAMVENGD